SPAQHKAPLVEIADVRTGQYGASEPKTTGQSAQHFDDVAPTAMKDQKLLPVILRTARKSAAEFLARRAPVVPSADGTVNFSLRAGAHRDSGERHRRAVPGACSNLRQVVRCWAESEPPTAEKSFCDLPPSAPHHPA